MQPDWTLSGAGGVAPTRPPSLSGVWLVLSVAGVPPAFFYLGIASSHSLGMMAAALVLIARFGTEGPSRSAASAIVNRDILRIAIWLPALLLIHLAVVGMVTPVDPMRAITSLFPLILLLCASGVLARALRDIPPEELDRQLMTAYGLFCLIALMGAIGLAPPTMAPDRWRKPAFPFTEPSHFALAFNPVFMYACVTMRGTKYLLVLLLGLIASILLQSLTLALGIALIATVTLRLGKFVLLLVPLGLVLVRLDLTYFVERVDISSDSSNLSSLVYLQGWQMIQDSFQRTHGLGFGFQQLGVNGTDVPAAILIRTLRGGEDLNVLDGGFMFAKLAGEFGVVGILCAVILTGLAFRSALILRKIANGRGAVASATLLGHCIIVTYMVELFARGINYFSGTSLMLATAFWLTAKADHHIGERLAEHPLHG